MRLSLLKFSALPLIEREGEGDDPYVTVPVALAGRSGAGGFSGAE